MQDLIGQVIIEERLMSKGEMTAEGWSGRKPPVLLVLSNGTKLYPSMDMEGNSPGVMFGIKDGKHFSLAE